MPSLKKINAEAGTNFRRWTEVSEVLKDVSPMVAEVLEAKVHRGRMTKAEHTAIHARTPNGHEPHAHDARNLMGAHEEAQPVPIPEANEPPAPIVTTANVFVGPVEPETKPEPVPEPTLDRDKARVRATNSAGSDDWKEDPVDKPVPQHIIDSMPDFPPRITNPTELWQMQGAGYQIEDGYPVKAPNGGDYQTGDVTWQFDGDGGLLSAWEPVRWNDARETMFSVITDTPLKDGLPNFQYHHAWINYMMRDKKVEAIQNVTSEIAAKRVAWFENGAKVHETTIGELLRQSLTLL